MLRSSIIKITLQIRQATNKIYSNQAQRVAEPPFHIVNNHDLWDFN